MKSQYTFLFLALFSLPFVSLKAQIYVNPNATGNNDGISWTDAYTELSAAIHGAQAGDAIWVAKGTYLPGNNPGATFQINKNIQLFGGFAGTESMLSQRNDSLNPTILSGDINGDDVSGEWLNFKDDNSRNIMTITTAINSSTIIDGFTFKGGQADTIVNYPASSGGAIFSTGNPIIRNCIFTENYADAFGGAVYLNGYAASGFLIEDCRFYQNKCLVRGGGISLGSITGSNSLIKDCHFEENEGTSIAGALRIYNSAVTVLGCSFINNYAEFVGGGVSLFQQANNLETIVENCIFDGNQSTIGGGFSIETEAIGSSIKVNNSQFRNNESKPFRAGYTPLGGGVSILFDPVCRNGKVSIKGSTFENNTVDRWGGGMNVEFYGPNCSLDVENCNFWENHLAYDLNSYGSGLRLSVRNRGSKANIRQSVFQNNSGGVSGAVSINTTSNGDLDAVISHCQFKENKSYEIGPGLTILTQSSADKAVYRIDNCLFENNQFTPSFKSTYGGGIFMTTSIDSFSAVVTHSEFRGNKNLKGGAAIEILPPTGTLASQHVDIHIENSLISHQDSGLAAIQVAGFPVTFSNLTIANNDMPALKGVNNAYLEIRNSIFNSLNHNDIELELGSIVTSLGGNLISDKSASQYLTAMDVENQDPAFEGGSTHPFKIRFDSPAVDLGQFYTGFDPMSPDLAGNPRLHGRKVDAGAYESPFTTAIKDLLIQNSSFNLYPNPVANFATIELENEWKGNLSLSIFNTLGQQLYSTQLNKNEAAFSHQLTLNWLPAGSYRLLLTDGKEALVKTFVRK